MNEGHIWRAPERSWRSPRLLPKNGEQRLAGHVGSTPVGEHESTHESNVAHANSQALTLLLFARNASGPVEVEGETNTRRSRDR